MNSNISFADEIVSEIKRLGSSYINIKRVVKNWWDVFLFKYGIIKSAKFKTYNGKIFNIENQKDYYNFWKEPLIYLGNNYKILEGANKVTVYLGKDYPKYYKRNKAYFTFDSADIIGDVIRQIRDILYIKEYSFIDPLNKTVVDIGANMGDTAIYFNLRGCKRVYAIEAMPRLYRLMVSNLKINKINNVFPINAVCSSSKKRYRLPAKSSWAGDIQENDRESQQVNSISLDEVVKRHSVRNAVLKIDCEGGEYGIILDATEQLLRKFDEIVIEYHYGYKNLVKKLLQSGFRVKHTIPTKTINQDLIKPIMYAGMIVADRIPDEPN